VVQLLVDGTGELLDAVKGCSAILSILPLANFIPAENMEVISAELLGSGAHS
jgi:hypothetical protein